jgi:2-C-methyl-D-erythritol 2,4-cyclodiphosphate synthase
LRATVELLARAGWRVGNVDATIIAQEPKMAPYLPQMVANIAADLQVPAGCVNVKAKTAERLGFVGRAEGVATEAVVLISRESLEDGGGTRR